MKQIFSEKHKKQTDATRIGEGRFWSLQTGFVAASHLLLIFINARRLLKKLPLMTPLFFFLQLKSVLVLEVWCFDQFCQYYDLRNLIMATMQVG